MSGWRRRDSLLPWGTVSAGITGTLQARFVEWASGPELRPCECAAAGLDLEFQVGLRLGSMPEPTAGQIAEIKRVQSRVSAELQLEGGTGGG